MELKAVSSEEGVEDLAVNTERELEKLCKEGKVEVVREKHEKRRYAINDAADHKS
jgi:hypothetical protein